MPERNLAPSLTGLVFDIGATSIKYGHISSDGQLTENLRRRSTPYPCSPDRLIEFIEHRMTTSLADALVIGFPGEVNNGVVVAPGNLARPGGPRSPVDEDLVTKWRGFDLQTTLTESLQKKVTVLNDASLAALGCTKGIGTEFVCTLGTGFGTAVVVDGGLAPFRDVGDEMFDVARTFDQALGEAARSENQEAWENDLLVGITMFVDELQPRCVHISGGNAKRLSPQLFSNISVPVHHGPEDAPFRGAARFLA